MTTFTKKLPKTLREDEVSKERIPRSTESNGRAPEDLLRKLDEAKRVDKELLQKLESNYEAMEELKKEISKERAINSYVSYILLSYCLGRPKLYSTRERERPGSPQDKRIYSHVNCHTTPPYEEEITHAAKRKRASSLAGPREIQHHYIQKSPSLFVLDHPFKNITPIGPTKESLPRIFDDWLSRMAKDKLPVVTEICFRLWPCGPFSSNNEICQYAAMIKTVPN